MSNLSKCYYRRFIKDCGKISRPPINHLKKNNFNWDEDAIEAFEKLKLALSNPPIIALPDFTQEFTLEINALGNGIGVVLMHKNRPISYFSKALSFKHQALSVYQKEMMATVAVVQKWRAYLIGRHFIIKTDHQRLKYLMEQRIATPMQQKWIAKLFSL
ncbi:hypothetical protein ACH5RR_013346 [Cinchona calisaya]|uniref:Reverse transcriptase RNase H-like domain-containing protein n=1 Tax=Cinchona calisaya TaxID=153742 RepID=A0ABD3A134_9GENT